MTTTSAEKILLPFHVGLLIFRFSGKKAPGRKNEPNSFHAPPDRRGACRPDQVAVEPENFSCHAGSELVRVFADFDNLRKPLRPGPRPRRVEKEGLGYCTESVAARVPPDPVARAA